MKERHQVVRALTEGSAAGRARQPATDCPYPEGDLRRSAWVRGHTTGRQQADES